MLYGLGCCVLRRVLERLTAHGGRSEVSVVQHSFAMRDVLNIHSQRDCAAACCYGPSPPARDSSPRCRGVELKPQRSIRGGANLVDWKTGHGADDHGVFGGRRAAVRRQLALGMQLRVSRRRAIMMGESILIPRISVDVLTELTSATARGTISTQSNASGCGAG